MDGSRIRHVIIHVILLVGINCCQDIQLDSFNSAMRPCHKSTLLMRPPIACRGAAQTLQSSPSQHIWISDQFLSSTLHRFLRTTCPHQKRHGSHVPGPLEARRRAAKRRMTASANFYPQESFPSSFDLSALFGFRSKTQPSWRYEPPTPRADPEPLATCMPCGTPIMHIES